MRVRRSEAAASVNVTARIRSAEISPDTTSSARVISIRCVLPEPAPAGTSVIRLDKGVLRACVGEKESGYQRVVQCVAFDPERFIEHLVIGSVVEGDPPFRQIPDAG
ncbi:hypothetical protein D9M68_281770 [compost metagenome]